MIGSVIVHSGGSGY